MCFRRWLVLWRHTHVEWWGGWFIVHWMARKALFEERIFEYSSEQNEESGHEKIRENMPGKESWKQNSCRWNEVGVFEDKQEVGRPGRSGWWGQSLRQREIMEGLRAMMRSLNSALSLVEKHCRVLTGKNCALYVFKRTLFSMKSRLQGPRGSKTSS